MTISDANPVQFWDPDQETFNEKEVDGIFRRCFCGPWNCSDTIPLQILHTTGQTLFLLVYDSDDEFLASIAFSEVATGVYYLAFIPQDYDICDDDVKFEISGTSGSQLLTNPDFTSNINGWSNSGTGAIWAYNSPGIGLGVAQADLSSSFLNTRTLQQTSLGLSSNNYYFRLQFQIIGFFGDFLNDFTGFIYITDASANVTTFSRRVVTSDPNDSIFSIEGNYTGSIASVGFQFTRVDTVLSTLVNVDYFYLYVSPGVLKKSDCLSIKEDHDETVLIEYSSNRNFAGLNYSDITPDPSFFLRIPAIFFRQRFPQEKETIELSNSRSIQLSAQVKAQKHLQIKNMPDYMHRKLLLALSHQFVTIEGQDWILAEEYELIPPSNPRWPMQKANCWLTEKDYIMRSIL